MALDNLITVEFTEEELATINEAIDNINTVLEGKARLRVTLSALHQPADVDALVEALARSREAVSRLHARGVA